MYYVVGTCTKMMRCVELQAAQAAQATYMYARTNTRTLDPSERWALHVLVHVDLSGHWLKGGHVGFRIVKCYLLIM